MAAGEARTTAGERTGAGPDATTVGASDAIDDGGGTAAGIVTAASGLLATTTSLTETRWSGLLKTISGISTAQRHTTKMLFIRAKRSLSAATSHASSRQVTRWQAEQLIPVAWRHLGQGWIETWTDPQTRQRRLRASTKRTNPRCGYPP